MAIKSHGSHIVFLLGAGASADAATNGPVVTSNLLAKALQTEWAPYYEDEPLLRLRLARDRVGITRPNSISLEAFGAGARRVWGRDALGGGKVCWDGG